MLDPAVFLFQPSPGPKTGCDPLVHARVYTFL